MLSRGFYGIIPSSLKLASREDKALCPAVSALAPVTKVRFNMSDSLSCFEGAHILH